MKYLLAFFISLIPASSFSLNTKSLLPEKIDTNNLFLVFPGLNGIDRNINDLVRNVKESDKDKNFNRLCHICDWSKDVNIFCAGDVALGAANMVTQELINIKGNDKLNLHLVGVSAGAIAANELCVFLKDFNKENYNIHLTLLDPFTLFRFNSNYGIYEFGRRANFCEQYLNRNDFVPFTNKAIKNAYVNDITFAKSKKKELVGKDVNGHDWPLIYYSNNWKDKTDPRNFYAVHEVLKRGDIRFIYD